MKKIFTLMFLMFSTSFAFTQILPNPGFELWETFTGYQDPFDWNTPNQYTSLAGVTTVSPSTDAHSGEFSAMLETKNILGGLYQAPGLLTLSDFTVNIASGTYTFAGGIALSDQVNKMTGFYKYTGANGDSASMMIISFRHPEGGEIDTVGLGYGFLHNASEWTEFSITMYPWSEAQPDSFNTIIMSSGSFDLNVGSVLLVDDLSLETVTGIINLSERTGNVKVYPNPVSEMVKFDCENSDTQRELIIFDNAGRQMKKISFTGKSVELNLGELSSGMYTYQLSGKNLKVESGSFLKK